jgi:hypothetical protein
MENEKKLAKEGIVVSQDQLRKEFNELNDTHHGMTIEPPTHKYDSEGNLIPIEQKSLSREQRRLLKRMQERRIKKLTKLKFKVEQERKKLERAQEAEAKRKAKGSN